MWHGSKVLNLNDDKLLGIWPGRWFEDNFNVLSAGNHPRDAGICPDKELYAMIISLSYSHERNYFGISQVNLLLS